MLVCPKCGTQLPFWSNYCGDCGQSLHLVKKETTLKWDESIAQAEVLKWLAQCERRLIHPLDSTERTGLSAFEYGWKAFNALYAQFDGKPDIEKMFQCIDAFLDKAEFMLAVYNKMARLCSYLLSDDYIIEFDYTVCESRKALNKAKTHCQKFTRCP